MTNKLISSPALVLLLTLALTACHHKPSDNTLTQENIKGDVSRITADYYYANNEYKEPKPGDFKHKIVSEYDKNGFINKETEYNSIGMVNQLTEYFYDDKNCLTRKTKKTYYNVSRNPTLISDISYNFVCDEKGKIVEEYSSELIDDTSKKIALKKIYTYDEKGNKISAKEYFYPGNGISQTTQYKYNANNQMIEELIHFGEGYFKQKISWKYNTNNQIEAYEDLRPQGVFFKYKASYTEPDKNGNWQRSMKSDSVDIELVKRKIEY